MGIGDIVTATFPIDVDLDNPAALAVSPVIKEIFPVVDYDNITSSVVPIISKNSLAKCVVVVTARRIS